MILAPSILSADLARLGEEVAAVERGGAGVVHVDVMDGQFVPNLTLGPDVVKAVRRVSELPIDVHLMIEKAERHIDAFVDAGASWVSVHVEAVPHLQRVVAQLKGRSVQAGVVLNPSTPLSTLEEILPEVDYVLLMSVNPGFSGQVFIPSTLDKIRRLRHMIRDRDLGARIEVDGGVSRKNIKSVVDAGAEIIVAGSASFAAGDPEAAARGLIEACA